MSSFSALALEKKLNELTNTQQSVQTLSLWIIHHRKHSKTIVQSWLKELQKAKPKKKLTFMYLTNDILQNSRKKGAEFSRDFSTVLPAAFRHCSKECTTDTLSALERILEIWKERDVYDQIFLDRLRKGMSIVNAIVEESDSPPPTKKPRTEDMKPPARIPDPDELIKKLTELEHSASQDAIVREQIAKLPSEITNPPNLDKIEDYEEAQKLLSTITEACSLLLEYNKRLSTELSDRQAETKKKLAKVTQVRRGLESHLHNLPDLTKLPDPNAGLAPLPSAGDLFAKTS
eukprot:gene13519-14930_t